MLGQPLCSFGEYTFSIMEGAEFFPMYEAHQAQVFQDTFDFRFREVLSDSERMDLNQLTKKAANFYRLNIGIFYKKQFVGWSFGIQENAPPGNYYMINSGILPQHQGKGIYSFLLAQILKIVQKEGFQIVTSRHVMTNNQILIPKLKAGFVITGFQLSDMFGTLVHLSYYFNPARRKVIDFRAGQSRPDEEIKAYLRL